MSFINLIFNKKIFKNISVNNNVNNNCTTIILYKTCNT